MFYNAIFIKPNIFSVVEDLRFLFFDTLVNLLHLYRYGVQYCSISIDV